jgi:hypothetical protein
MIERSLLRECCYISVGFLGIYMTGALPGNFAISSYDDEEEDEEDEEDGHEQEQGPGEKAGAVMLRRAGSASPRTLEFSGDNDDDDDGDND